MGLEITMMKRLTIFVRDLSGGLRYGLFILWKNKLTFIGLVLISALVFLAIFAPFIAPYDPDKTYGKKTLNPPSKENLLGTDFYGRDILSRMLYGLRLDLSIAFVVLAIAFTVGSVVGSLAGYLGRIYDDVIMRLVDILLSIPDFILAMGLVIALGHSIPNIILAISVPTAAGYARLVRGEMLSVKENEYAEAARCVGNSTPRIIFIHLYPNCLPPLIVTCTLSLGWIILTTAGLGFLGIGIQPPISELGSMTSEGVDFLLTGEWWVSVFPGLGIFITVLGFNLMGDGLRDIFDPKRRIY